AAGDVVVDVEVLMLACRLFQQFGALYAVQGELPQVVVVVGGADQVGNGVTRDDAGRVQTQGFDFCLAAAQVVHLQLAALHQGGGDPLPNVRVDLGGQQRLAVGQRAHAPRPVGEAVLLQAIE